MNILKLLLDKQLTREDWHFIVYSLVAVLALVVALLVIIKQ